MRLSAHYFQHVPFEGLGSMEAWLRDAGYTIGVTRWYAGDLPPDPAALDLLIVMGGPMSVNDEADYPWLASEKAFIRQWIDSGRPLLGICLGAQLIASALGARVYPNAQKEIGWFPVTAVTPLPGQAFPFPPEQNVFHWHGETFDLPPGAMHLAHSAACKNQAFQIGRTNIGLQFHLETTPASAAALIDNCRNELIHAPFVQDEATLRAATPTTYTTINTLMDKILAHITAK